MDMDEFCILLPTKDLPSVAEWRAKLKELEPGFDCDTKFDIKKLGVWECTYTDEDCKESYCCDIFTDSTKKLFESAPELKEYTQDAQCLVGFLAEESEDEFNSNLAASFALAEALLALRPEGFLYDPNEGQLMYGEDAVVFFHEELEITDEDEED